MIPVDKKIDKMIDQHFAKHKTKTRKILLNDHNTQKLQHFFNNVMMDLGFYDWTLNLKPDLDSYCWIKQKRIDIGLGYEGDIRQIILHEIAHIGTARFCNQKHNVQFWVRLCDLVQKWLGTGLDEHQLQHKRATIDGGRSS